VLFFTLVHCFQRGWRPVHNGKRRKMFSPVPNNVCSFEALFSPKTIENNVGVFNLSLTDALSKRCVFGTRPHWVLAFEIVSQKGSLFHGVSVRSRQLARVGDQRIFFIGVKCLRKKYFPENAFFIRLFRILYACTCKSADIYYWLSLLSLLVNINETLVQLTANSHPPSPLIQSHSALDEFGKFCS